MVIKKHKQIDMCKKNSCVKGPSEKLREWGRKKMIKNIIYYTNIVFIVPFILTPWLPEKWFLVTLYSNRKTLFTISLNVYGGEVALGLIYCFI
jgi:hypothetical protein